MRARPAAFVPVLLTLMVVGAGCGGDDSENAATPTPDPAAVTSGSGTSGGATSGSGAAGDDAGSSSADGPQSPLSAKDSITTQISKNPDLRTLSTLINAAGLASALDGGRYTVFAPNNDAFTKLGTQLDTLLQPGNKAQLQNILKFHVVENRIRSKRLSDGRLLTTLQGTRIRVTRRGDQVLVGNSLGKTTVLTPDAKASNGIIHTVDTVLRPKAAN